MKTPIFSLLVIFSSNFTHAKDIKVSESRKQELFKAASVWQDTGSIAAKEVVPAIIPDVGIAPHGTLECTFDEEGYIKVQEGTGRTEKFWCITKDGKRFKIKYGGEANREVYAE